jgi:hypothetical protein
LRYTAGTVQANPFLNSAMQNWQRGTSVSLAASNTLYTADRWCIQSQTNQALTVTRQATNDTTNLPFIQYCMRLQRNSGQTGVLPILQTQSFETINSIPFAGKTVTVSYYARKGADYSAASSAFASNLIYGTGTDQNVTGTYTGFAVAGAATATLTTTWQRFSYSATIPSTATEIGLYNQFTPTGTASTNDYFESTGFQIDIGNVALPFRTYAGTIQGELAACQRYYYQLSATNNSYTRFGNGITVGTSNAHCAIKMAVTMRIAPSVVTTATASNYVVYTGSNFTLTSVPTIDQTTNDFVVLACSTSASQTINAANFLAANNSTAALLGFNAEL